MTALLARQPCTHCGNVLVPPILAQVTIEELELDTDYVCLACGCTYRWMGNAHPTDAEWQNVVRRTISLEA